MAISVNNGSVIPQITLDRLQYRNINIKVNDKPPYTQSVSAQVQFYGLDGDNVRHYENNNIQSINISDMTAFITQLSPSKQAIAVPAMIKLQEALADLAKVVLDIDVNGVI